MGSELLSRTPGKQSLVSPSYDAPAVTTPGKATLTEQLASSVDGDLARVARYAGMTVTDGGNFEYVVREDGSFEIRNAPPKFQRLVGGVIAIATRPGVWGVLHDLLFAQHSTPPPTTATPASPAPVAKPTAAPPIATPVPTVAANLEVTREGHYQLVKIPLVRGDVARVTPWVPAGAKLVTPEHAYERPETTAALACGTYARVLEVDRTRGIAQVATLDGPSATSDGEVVWVRINKLVRLNRAPRPSTAQQQMQALVAAARANKGESQGKNCFRFVKNYIAIAGGYGDFADVYTDPRFDGMGHNGKDFATQVEKAGLRELGLERVGGTLAEQPAGTIVCTQANRPDPDNAGNGINGISIVSGDIAVVDKNVGGYTICYNDAIVPFATDPKHWASGGKLEGSLVAMYRPIDRA